MLLYIVQYKIATYRKVFTICKTRWASDGALWFLKSNSEATFSRLQSALHIIMKRLGVKFELEWSIRRVGDNGVYGR